MGIGAIISAITGIAGKAVDKIVADKDLAEKLKAEITLTAMTHGQAELEAATKVIVAEASGSWLQRSWRPLTMLVFVSLVVAHWLGYTAENLSEAQILALMDIVQIGIGGYVLGRSAEKVVKEYKS